ncbi:hypothetical protein PR202_gb00707 [Eleusine coracana subsp. coracana]|uniref:Uncharacterized protein n=1 Tax=Eleusine coracana subsp. coracana TaxID=191504 RepID=A0AAV5DVI9_ELECO|nr:hypothetical protein PR202_gb00707 [Eleusine coracana subsp. coracana]
MNKRGEEKGKGAHDAGDKDAHDQPPESSAQGAARGRARILCHKKLVCDICLSIDHARERCPQYNLAESYWYARPCGFSVKGFFYIPHSVAVPMKKGDGRAARVRVTEGAMNAEQVAAELNRLVPVRWECSVQQDGHNTFKTIFPSTAELQWMIGLATVKTKIQGYAKENVVEDAVGQQHEGADPYKVNPVLIEIDSDGDEQDRNDNNGNDSNSKEQGTNAI